MCRELHGHMGHSDRLSSQCRREQRCWTVGGVPKLDRAGTRPGARLGETRKGNTWQPWPWHNNLDSPLFFSSFSVAVLSRLMHLFLLSVFLSPPRAVMVTQWIRTNAAHYVTCPLPQQWWQNRITKGKSMPRG